MQKSTSVLAKYFSRIYKQIAVQTFLPVMEFVAIFVMSIVMNLAVAATLVISCSWVMKKGVRMVVRMVVRIVVRMVARMVV